MSKLYLIKLICPLIRKKPPKWQPIFKSDCSFQLFIKRGTYNPASIGKNVSHGCIRMFNHGVLELSSRVTIGTKVFIHK